MIGYMQWALPSIFFQIKKKERKIRDCAIGRLYILISITENGIKCFPESIYIINNRDAKNCL